MAPPTGSGGSPAPIDRPILEFLRERLEATPQVDRAHVTDEDHLALRVRLGDAYYPDDVREARLTVRWYENDDFAVHYRESRDDRDWECRWDRHPNPHNARDHFHEPPDASTPGRDASWPTDYREVLGLVLDEVEDRIADCWRE